MCGRVQSLQNIAQEIIRILQSDRQAHETLANASFVEQCRPHGLGGMEFLVAIPGSIGGAIAMNAGAHDGETAAFLRQVRLYEVGAGVRDEVGRAADVHIAVPMPGPAESLNVGMAGSILLYVLTNSGGRAR